jgi:antitoxin CcdA
MPETTKRIAFGPRISTELTLPEALVDHARNLGVNLSAAAERGIMDAAARVADAGFAERHRPAIEAWNAWLAEHGSPLDDLRAF